MYTHAFSYCIYPEGHTLLKRGDLLMNLRVEM